jgi:ATP-binding cassette subfamily B protein
MGINVGALKDKARFFKALIRIIQFLWGINPAYSIILCLINIIQGLVPTSLLWVSKLIVDTVIQGIGTSPGAFSKSIPLLLLLLTINLLSYFLQSAANVLQTLLGDSLSNRISIKIMDKSVSLDLSHFENPTFYDMLIRAQREASYKPLSIMNHIFDLPKNFIAFGSMVLVLFRLHWLVVLILIIACTLQSISQQKYAKTGYSMIFGQTQDTRKMHYLSGIIASANFFKEIKLYRLGEYLLNKYNLLFNKIYADNRRILLRKNISFFSWSLFGTLNYIGTYAYIIYRTITKAISVGDLTLYSGAFLQCQSRINGIINNIVSLYENNLYISNLFAFLDLKSNIVADPALKNPLSSIVSKGITFNRVSFRYPGSNRTILEDLSFHIEPNECVAFVGDNGAGKTTVIKLLARFYDPDQGAILIDGKNIRTLDPLKYQELMGVVFQDYSQFNLTARENIGFGWIREIENTTRIDQAASNSGAKCVIDRLPLGYASVLGKIFDDGTQLSVGEWQKIAIARAFMRDGKILILDEPTASVDVKTEYEIFEHLKELAKGKITIFISHRFSTVRMADKIFVLENGKVIEQGTHINLMNLHGKYAAMFTMQAERYV